MIMIKIHAHALHRIMCEPKSIDEQLITAEIATIIKRTKRTDEEKLLIQQLKNQTLSEGAKTAIEEWVIERAYGFKDFTGNKYTEKGLSLEDSAIMSVQMNSLFTMGQYTKMTKNEITFENAWLIGTPDIINLDHGRDTKCSWSGVQHPWSKRKADKKMADSGYEYQNRAYMDLTQKKRWFTDFVLLPTPVELTFTQDQREQQIDLVNAIPLSKRISSVAIDFEQNKNDLIHLKCELAQAYALQYAHEIGVYEILLDRAKEYKVPFPNKELVA